MLASRMDGPQRRRTKPPRNEPPRPQTRPERLPASGSSRLINAGVFLKYVLQPRVLQDRPGASIATEFGPLLLGINGDPGLGFSWAGSISQPWDWGTVHFGVEANLTRDQRGEPFLDAIIEGPFKRLIRPVAEALL